MTTPKRFICAATIAMLSHLTVGCTTIEAETIVSLAPGQNVNTRIQNAPAGAIFRFAPGTYRRLSFVPKDNQQFIGRPGVVLSGAVEVTGWKKGRDFWRKTWDRTRLRRSGRCRKRTPLCRYREDLFVDGALYQRVASYADLGPRKWIDDGQVLYLGDDPTNRKVELSVTPRAFGGRAKNVVLKDLVIEQYASPAQKGAIDAKRGVGWLLENVVVRFNHGVGIRIGKKFRLRGGSYSYNGQLGVGGDGTDSIIEDAEIAHNNFAGFSAAWEAGGSKFWRAENLIVRRACVHHNDGPGLWTDMNNKNILYEHNKVFENTGDGIKHEISFSATIRNNLVVRNGRGKDNWLWGSQILVQNSNDVVVHNNIVELADRFGNGISIINQDREHDRDPGWEGSYIAKDNRVFDNRIIHLGSRGRNGLVADHLRTWFHKDGNNKFDKNTYVMPRENIKSFGIDTRFRTWKSARKRGFEPNGTLKIEQRKPTAVSCP